MTKILIVDDEDIARAMLSNALVRAGHEVVVTTNGEEALDLLRRGDVRLVITDWEMPVMNGLDLCRAIRRRDCGGYAYVILLTSRGESAEIVEGMSAGADDFIVKPFNHAELMARVRAGERVLSLETREMVIFALAKLAESRDPETGHHLERVQWYSRRLAEALMNHSPYAAEIDPEFVRLVHQTSPLHDIGKVGIPDCVLLKPGRLTDEEFDIMKTHTLIGAKTLDAALTNYPQARFLQIARDIALSHHERWDGFGYPNGLKGEEIPLAARIVAVADVYDALTSKRVYKGSFTHTIAREVIFSEAGSHLDPVVTEAFREVEAEFVETRLRMAAEQTNAEDGAAVGGPLAPSLTTASVSALCAMT
jgi:putative two-component system response regulator